MSRAKLRDDVAGVGNEKALIFNPFRRVVFGLLVNEAGNPTRLGDAETCPCIGWWEQMPEVGHGLNFQCFHNFRLLSLLFVPASLNLKLHIPN